MRRKKTLKRFSYMLLFLFAAGASYGQQLIYMPINPSFGGNSYAGQWLLSEAQAQNSFTESRNLTSSYTRDPLQDFKESLNRQILSQIARQLATKTFGEEGLLQDGHFELGDFIIDITQALDGVHISILDITNGNETTILVPYF